MSRTLTILGLALAALVPSPLLACSCAGPIPVTCGSRLKDSAAFVGTVLSVEGPVRGPDPWKSIRYRFHVDEAFWGVEGETAEVYSGDTSCLVTFEIGRQYLVRAGKRWKRLSTGLCSGNLEIEIEYAQTQLPQLRALRDGRPTASLYGQVQRLNLRYGQTWVRQFRPKPLANTVVRADIAGQTFETTTDENGRYAFYDLPSGKLQLDAILPSNLKASLGYHGFPVDRWEAKRALKLPSKACFQQDLVVMPTAQIRGRVLGANGRPLRPVLVELVLLESYETGAKGATDMQGRHKYFQFDHLEPGQYLLIAYPLGDKKGRKHDFPPTFYPGTTDFLSARVIELKPGEQFLEADIRLPSPQP